MQDNKTLIVGLSSFMFCLGAVAINIFCFYCCKDRNNIKKIFPHVVQVPPKDAPDNIIVLNIQNPVFEQEEQQFIML